MRPGSTQGGSELSPYEKSIRGKRLLQAANAPPLHLSHADRIEDTGPWNDAAVKTADVIGSCGIISLIGGRGRGKTQMAVEVIRETTIIHLQSALYSRASEFFMELREAYKDGLKITERGVFERFTKPHLLVLDECHERGFTDHENRALVLLIDKRYCDAKPTILIANMTPEEMRRNIGESIFDRLIETGGYIVCDWESFRVKGA